MDGNTLRLNRYTNRTKWTHCRNCRNELVTVNEQERHQCNKCRSEYRTPRTATSVPYDLPRWARIEVSKRTKRINQLRFSLNKKYGITPDEWHTYSINGCEVCGSAGEVIDHNHNTGKVRGCLCNNCNSALGFAKDNPSILCSLAEYLQNKEE